MTRKDIKNALSASLKAEEKAVENRFEKAESVFAKKSDFHKEQSNKQRVIRDSFTLPTADYDLISQIKERCLEAGINVTKSETIRAGLNALHELSDKDLRKVMERLVKVKTGRPPEQ
jgi:hypothetical protein